MSDERQERCDGCRFWRRFRPCELYPSEDILLSDEKDDLAIAGECRRFPPALNVVEMGRRREERLKVSGYSNYDQPHEGAFTASVFPVTLDDEWCGEFQPCEPS